MRIFLLAPFFVLPALDAQAQDAQQKILIADCSTGSGCTCSLGGMTVEETAVLLGVETPPSGYVVLKDGAGFSFDPRGLDALHRAYGGEGVCEIELFEEEDGGIVPRDGLWSARVVDATFSNCNAMVETMLRSSGALTQPQESGRITWGGRFDPDVLDFYIDDGQRVIWEPAGQNAYRGQLYEEASCDGDSCAGVSVDLTMRITAPDRIESSSDFDISTFVDDAGGMEVMQQMGLAECRIRTFFEMTHQSD